MMIIMMIAPPGPCPDIGHVMYGFLFMQRWPQYVRYQNNTFPAPPPPPGRHDRYMGKCSGVVVLWPRRRLAHLPETIGLLGSINM